MFSEHIAHHDNQDPYIVPYRNMFNQTPIHRKEPYILNIWRPFIIRIRWRSKHNISESKGDVRMEKNESKRQMCEV